VQKIKSIIQAQSKGFILIFFHQSGLIWSGQSIDLQGEGSKKYVRLSPFSFDQIQNKKPDLKILVGGPLLIFFGFPA
jgi:hypothetical protein